MTVGILRLAIFFFRPCSPYLLLIRNIQAKTTLPAAKIRPTQTKELMPAIYIMANRIIRIIIAPPRYQMYWALSPRNSIGVLMPLLILYTLFAILAV